MENGLLLFLSIDFIANRHLFPSVFILLRTQPLCVVHILVNVHWWERPQRCSMLSSPNVKVSKGHW